jgi:hypothetical protein
VRRISVALAVVALSFVAGSAAAQPCGRAVLDDWYDNGKFDHSWSCDCLLDALTLLPEDVRPRFVPIQEEEVGRQLRARCVDRDIATSEPVVTLLESRFPGTDRSIGVDDDLLPWHIAIVGMVTGGLLVLIGAAAVRQRRLRL